MILRLEANIQRKIWGGEKLERFKKLTPVSNVDPVGETWEISTHKDGPSLVNGKALLNTDLSSPLKYLVKFIDTGADLSIQVHPHDEYARAHENSLGKTECWIILDTKEGAGIYLGLKSNVTKEQFESAILNKENMDSYLNFYEVKKGDFFFVPAGSIHAIGKGITLAEIQQSSGITYRVWDWNRLDSKGEPRELHVKKSLDVINFDSKANELSYFNHRTDLFLQNGLSEIVSHDDFRVSVINLKANEKIRIMLDSKRISSVLNLENEILINGMAMSAFSSVILDCEQEIEVVAVDDSSFIFVD